MTKARVQSAVQKPFAAFRAVFGLMALVLFAVHVPQCLPKLNHNHIIASTTRTVDQQFEVTPDPDRDANKVAANGGSGEYGAVLGSVWFLQQNRIALATRTAGRAIFASRNTALAHRRATVFLI